MPTPTLQQVSAAGAVSNIKLDLIGGVQGSDGQWVTGTGYFIWANSGDPFTDNTGNISCANGGAVIDANGQYLSNVSSQIVIDSNGSLYYVGGAQLTSGSNLQIGGTNAATLNSGAGTTPPTTSVIVLPTTVYGTSSALLANPSRWLLVKVGGVFTKIPCFD